MRRLLSLLCLSVATCLFLSGAAIAVALVGSEGATGVSVLGAQVAAGDRALGGDLTELSPTGGEAARNGGAFPGAGDAAPAPVPGTWAVVVGVDDYPGSSHDLRAGVADALDVVALLRQSGVASERMHVLLDEQATATSVRDAVRWLVDNAGPADTAMIFFSGHVREVSGDRDGDGEAVDEALTLSDGGQYFDGELAADLASIRARHTWLALAGCYAGGFDDAVRPGVVLTGASPEGLLAYENDRFGRTYLVEYMIRRAMTLDGLTSVQDAFAQARDQIERDYPNRVPVILDRTDAPVSIVAG